MLGQNLPFFFVFIFLNLNLIEKFQDLCVDVLPHPLHLFSQPTEAEVTGKKIHDDVISNEMFILLNINFSEIYFSDILNIPFFYLKA